MLHTSAGTEQLGAEGLLLMWPSLWLWSAVGPTGGSTGLGVEGSGLSMGLPCGLAAGFYEDVPQENKVETVLAAMAEPSEVAATSCTIAAAHPDSKRGA